MLVRICVTFLVEIRKVSHIPWNLAVLELYFKSNRIYIFFQVYLAICSTTVSLGYKMVWLECEAIWINSHLSVRDIKDFVAPPI